MRTPSENAVSHEGNAGGNSFFSKKERVSPRPPSERKPIRREKYYIFRHLMHFRWSEMHKGRENRGERRLDFLKALTKSTLCQTLKKPARQGRKLAGKGAYIDVSNRSLQVHLTQQAKIPSTFSLFEGIFAFAGFVSGLGKSRRTAPRFSFGIWDGNEGHGMV